MPRVINVGAEAVAKQGGEFTLIPAGTKLRGVVYEAEEGVSGPNAKRPGLPQLTYTFKVTEDGEFKGREVRYNRVPLHGEGGDTWKLITFAQAVGWPVSDDGEVEIPDNVLEVQGTEIVARVGQQASQKINPATNTPYINNTVAGTLNVKDYKGRTETKATERPKW